MTTPRPRTCNTPSTDAPKAPKTPRNLGNICGNVSSDKETLSGSQTSLFDIFDISPEYSVDNSLFSSERNASSPPRKSATTLHPFFTLSSLSITEDAIKRTDTSGEHEYISSTEDSTTRSEQNLFDISRIASNDDQSLSSDSDMSICSFDDEMAIDLDEESHFDRPRRIVHFPFDVVTEVRFRPKTEPNQVAILFSNPRDWDRSCKEDRRERKAGVAWTIDAEREKRARFAYNPVTEIHIYAMDIPIPQEPQEHDLVSNELFVAREIPSESLQPPEGAIESSSALSMNDCLSKSNRARIQYEQDTY
eukprot:scaffold92357_cov47-Attheya_sp.AAC.3